MKQTITMQRTETITLQIEVLQKLTPKAQAEWANSGGIGGVGMPAAGQLITHLTTDWSPVASPKAKKGGRRG